jgi:MYXO-CTERM domain-containing protein
MTKCNLCSMASLIMTLVLGIPCRGQSLDGEPLEVSRTHGPSLQESKGTATNVVVGPGVELTNFGAFTPFEIPPSGVPGFVDVDISATSILITLTRNQTFSAVEYLRFVLSNTPPYFIGVTINPATDWAGFAAQPIRAEASGPNTFVNLAGLTGLQGQKILLDLNLIPEPSGAALGAIGLAGAGVIRRRRSRGALG